MTDEDIKAINELAAETRRATDFAIGTIEREKRIMNAYIAFIGVLLALLLGMLVYTGYVAYAGTESAVEAVKWTGSNHKEAPVQED